MFNDIFGARFTPKVPSEEELAILRLKGVEARHARAVFKDDIHAGKYTLEQAITKAQRSSMLSRMYVREIVGSFFGIGPTKVERIFVKAKISPNRRVKGLTDKQTQRLIEVFTSRNRR